MFKQNTWKIYRCDVKIYAYDSMEYGTLLYVNNPYSFLTLYEKQVQNLLERGYAENGERQMVNNYL